MDINNLSAIEKQKLSEIIEDPVKWSQVFVRAYNKDEGKYLPWVARWYQGEMLRDESTRKVARCGRRTGKCLPPWVKVFDPTNGERVSIEELYKRQTANILTMHEDFKVLPTTTDIVIDNGIKEVFKVKLKSGREIDATGNHPLYTPFGWREIDELSIGDRVAVPKALPYFGKEDISDKNLISLARNSGYKNQDISTDKNKALPDSIFKLSREKTVLFLSEFLRANGWVTKKNDSKSPTGIGYTARSKELVMDIQHLLLKFEIDSQITEDNFNGYIDSYTVCISKQSDINTFIEEIGTYREDNVQSEEIYNESLTSRDIVWEKIKSIELVGKHQTYDLTVPKTHNFIANDIIVHNTETMCIDMLHRSNKNNNYRCLVATPYENQVRLIFNRLKELIDSSPLLKGELKRFTMSPFVIEWKNGSSVVGFTTGAASGSGGASIRGQRAD